MSELSARVIVGSKEVRVEVAESINSGVPEPPSVGLRDFCDIVFCRFALLRICCVGGPLSDSICCQGAYAELTCDKGSIGDSWSCLPSPDSVFDWEKEKGPLPGAFDNLDGSRAVLSI